MEASQLEKFAKENISKLDYTALLEIKERKTILDFDMIDLDCRILSLWELVNGEDISFLDEKAKTKLAQKAIENKCKYVSNYKNTVSILEQGSYVGRDSYPHRHYMGIEGMISCSGIGLIPKSEK